MKCNNCGKKLDEVDCSCKWCTFCGTVIDAKSVNASDGTEAK
ncbi:MAG: hypothetical protein NT036_03735 [Candidatus Omnitrophica bacterium]|nr:hypothetical protein [Candidatus Omnitrophota bacterium]